MVASQTTRFIVSRRRALALGGGFGFALANLKLGTGWAQSTPAALDLSAYPELKITATDHAVELSTDTVPAGFVLITLENKMSQSPNSSGGSSVVGPPAGMSFTDFMTQVQPNGTPISAQNGLPPIAYKATVLGGPGNLDPGQTGQAIVKIPAGQWAVTPPGNQQFMTLTATADKPGVTTAPASAVTITEVDFSFSGFNNIPAGPQIWEVVHKGTQPHMLVLISAPAGTTIDQVIALFNEPQNATPVPGGVDPSTFKDAGGVDLQSAGTTVYPILNLAAGTYVALCFVGDPNKGGEPHAMEGMINVFNAG